MFGSSAERSEAQRPPRIDTGGTPAERSGATGANCPVRAPVGSTLGVHAPEALRRTGKWGEKEGVLREREHPLVQRH